MALPADFWKNEQSLNIFRTKTCQRLARDGVCGWRSQCQYSHNLEWPRRQTRRHNYSPELCPNIAVFKNADGDVERIENNCSAGLRCAFAHSKEEVLFHPDMFKTSLCEDYSKTDGSNQKSRSAKKNRCHRYYCPFAHGADELRTSGLTTDQKERGLRSMEVFPSDVCCQACTRHWITPLVVNDKTCPEPACLGFEPGALGYPSLLSHKAPQPSMGQPFDVLSTVPNLPSLMRDIAHKPLNKDKAAPASPIQKPQHHPDMFGSMLFKPDMHPSLFHGDPWTQFPKSSGLQDYTNSTHDTDAPAFIHIPEYNSSLGQRPPTTSPYKAGPTSPGSNEKAKDLLGEYFFAML